MTDDLMTKEAAFWEHWRLKGTGIALDALWLRPSDFLRDWDEPLAELAPKDESLVKEGIRVKVIAMLVVDVCDASEKLKLPAESPPADELADRLEDILDGSRGRIPSNTYAKLYRLHEWLTRPAIELRAIESRRGMSDDEWASYVQRIESGR